jgi:outer membrane biosynthesis protein TonB
MNRFARVALTASVLSAGTLLASCGTYDPSSFDPTAIFDMEIFNTKKKLPGERKPVFPEGTPGVTQGVPQEMVKGYQEPGAEAKEAQAAAPKPPPAEAKPKPKPKVVAKPKEESTPTAVTVRPSQPQPQEAQAQSQPQSQTQWPDPPSTQQQRPAAGGAWPGSPQPAGGGVAWPDPPAPR